MHALPVGIYIQFHMQSILRNPNRDKQTETSGFVFRAEKWMTQSSPIISI